MHKPASALLYWPKTDFYVTTDLHTLMLILISFLVFCYFLKPRTLYKQNLYVRYEISHHRIGMTNIQILTADIYNNFIHSQHRLAFSNKIFENSYRVTKSEDNSFSQLYLCVTAERLVYGWSLVKEPISVFPLLQLHCKNSGVGRWLAELKDFCSIYSVVRFLNIDRGAPVHCWTHE